MKLVKSVKSVLSAPMRGWRTTKNRSFEFSAIMAKPIVEKIHKKYSKIECFCESAILHLERGAVPDETAIQFFSKLGNNRSDLKFSKEENGFREHVVLLVLDWKLGKASGLDWLKGVFVPFLSKCKEKDLAPFSLEALAKSGGIKLEDYFGLGDSNENNDSNSGKREDSSKV